MNPKHAVTAAEERRGKADIPGTDASTAADGAKDRRNFKNRRVPELKIVSGIRQAQVFTGRVPVAPEWKIVPAHQTDCSHD